MTKRLVTLAALALTAVLAVSACGGETVTTAPTSTPTRVPVIAPVSATGAVLSVPANVTLVASVQVQKALADKDIQDGLNQAIPLLSEGRLATLDEALAQAEEEIGINPGNIKEVVAFFGGDIFSGGDYGGVLVQGSFNKTKIVEAIERADGQPLERVSYKGQEVITSDRGDTDLAFLAGDLFVIGSRQAVEDVIDVRAGGSPALSGKLLEAYEALGSPLAKVAVLIPLEALDQLHLAVEEGELPRGLDLSLYLDIRTVGASIDKRGSDVTLRLAAGFGEAASAETVAEGIGGLITFFRAFNPLTLLDPFLDKLNASAQGTQAIVEAQLTIEELRDLVETLVVIPNMGRFQGRGESEARNTEFQNVQTAVAAMMVDNKLKVIPNPVQVPTNDMGAFPDATSDPVKVKGMLAGDKPGYVLYQHDITRDGTQTGLVNYVAATRFTQCYYIVDTYGTVTQVGCQ